MLNIKNVKREKLKKVSKRFYNNKDEFLQQRGDTYAGFKNLDNRLEALEEKQSVNNNST